MDNLKKIFILPDRSSEIMLAACTIYPTYMTNVAGDFKDVQEVLAKLQSRLSMV
ncbi:MAG: hypothetical protein WBB19_10765 [Desulforhopalus sp.]